MALSEGMEKLLTDSEGGPKDETDTDVYVGNKRVCVLQHELRQKTGQLLWSLILNVVLLFVALGCCLVWSTDGWPFTINLSLKRSNAPSALLDRFKFDLHDDVYNATIWDDHSSIFRNEPSPAGDAAWERISAVGYIALTEQEVRAIGRDPLEAAKIPSSWGVGDDLYPGYLDGQHLIHCLKHVRKMVYFQYYYTPIWGPKYNALNMPNQHKAHTSHCLDILLQSLRCQPSMSVNTLQYIDDVDNIPYIDPRTPRKCVNHEALLDWQTKNAWITEERLDTIMRRPETPLFQKPQGGG